MSLTKPLIDDFRIKYASEKIASGIEELKNLGFEKSVILEGVQVQLDHSFKDVTE